MNHNLIEKYTEEFGNVLFGDGDYDSRMQDVNFKFKRPHEKNTELESKIFDTISSGIFGHWMGTNKDVVFKQFSFLLKFKNDYPEILKPPTNDLGRIEFLHHNGMNANKHKQLNGNKGVDITYNPKSSVQSGTTYKEIENLESEIFSCIGGQQDNYKHGRIPVIFHATIPEDQILFNPEFLNEFMSGTRKQNEVVRVSQKPLKCKVMLIHPNAMMC